AFYHPVLLAFDAVLVGALAVIVWLLGRGGTRTAIDESRAKYEVAAWLQELARHETSFRSAHGARFAWERASALTARYLQRRRDHFDVVFRQITGSLVLQVVASAALLGVGGWLVISRQLTLGQLVAAEIIVSTVLASFAKFGKHLEGWYDLLASLDKVGHLTDLPLEPRRTAEAPASSSGPIAVSVHGVHFGYDAHTVFDGLGFDVAAGDRVALVGAAGSGKTTLASLLFARRTPDAGSVLLDDVDTRAASGADLRRGVAIVGRASEILDGTVAENVSLARPGVGPKEVRRALVAVGLDAAIDRLPQGVATRLLPSGRPLTDTQCQLLMFARALAEQPRLIVLDDALDGLDDGQAAIVTAALVREDAPWTLIALASAPDALTSACNTVRPLAPDADVSKNR
ncbi:MAG: ABC transporter ATP-binding protein, partial [Deltaproteobacteria bacterium]